MTTFTDATLAASDETVCNTIIQTKALANSVGTPKVESRCDDELIALAEELFDADKILEAFRHLQNVRNVDLLSEKHHRMCKIASECSAAISDLLSEPGSAESGWTKQGESHGHHDTVIYYKVDDGANLTCRLETPIEFSLLVPLLSVFNESNLYADWVPYWKIPKVGIRSSRQLEQIGRANQILQIIGDVPWPFSLREVMMKTVAVDEIDTRGYFAVRLHSAETGGVVPPPDPSMKRVDLKGALLFRSCPMDHPILVKSKNTTCTCTDPMILVSFKMYVRNCRFVMLLMEVC